MDRLPPSSSSPRYYWKAGVRTTKPPLESEPEDINANNSTVPASPSQVDDHDIDSTVSSPPSPIDDHDITSTVPAPSSPVKEHDNNSTIPASPSQVNDHDNNSTVPTPSPVHDHDHDLTVPAPPSPAKEHDITSTVPSPVNDHDHDHDNKTDEPAEMPGASNSVLNNNALAANDSVNIGSTTLGEIRPVRFVFEGAPEHIPMTGTIENATAGENADATDDELVEAEASASRHDHEDGHEAAMADNMSRLNINEESDEDDEDSDEEDTECPGRRANAPCSIHDVDESVFDITVEQNLFRHQAVFGQFYLQPNNTIPISFKGVCGLNHPGVNGGRGITFDFPEFVPCFLCFRDIGKPSSMNCPHTSKFVSEIVSRRNQAIMDLHPWECQVCGKKARELSHLPIPFFNPALGDSVEFRPYIWDYAVPVCRSLGECDARAEQMTLQIVRARFPGRIHVAHSCKACGAPGKLLDCGRCGAIKYCSKPCQVADWPKHKANCRLVQKEAKEKKEEKKEGNKKKGKKGKKGKGKQKA